MDGHIGEALAQRADLRSAAQRRVLRKCSRAHCAGKQWQAGRRVGHGRSRRAAKAASEAATQAKSGARSRAQPKGQENSRPGYRLETCQQRGGRGLEQAGHVLDGQRVDAVRNHLICMGGAGRGGCAFVWRMPGAEAEGVKRLCGGRRSKVHMHICTPGQLPVACLSGSLRKAAPGLPSRGGWQESGQGGGRRAVGPPTGPLMLP